MTRVQEVLDPLGVAEICLPRGMYPCIDSYANITCLGLGHFVVVVREFEVDAAAVYVHALAEDVARHH